MWHVARRHLELAQLWRCPVSWCTVWRGAPQDLMDHIREAHNVPGEIRKVSLESFFLHGQSHARCIPSPWRLDTPAFRTTCCCSATLDCRWFITTECTRGAFRMPRFAGNIWRSCALSYRCLRSCRPREHPTLPARLCHARRILRMFCVPCLDRPDAQLVAGGQYGGGRL